MPDIESGNQSSRSGSQNSSDEKKNRFELYIAALSNDWRKAETVYRNASMKYGARITSTGETALHVAALAGHVKFVQNLVDKMDPEEIRTEAEPGESGKGNTAFHCAVVSGNVQIAEAILKSEDLHDFATAKGAGNSLPINMAAEKGNEQMVRFLYDFTYRRHPEALNCRDENEDNEALFLNLIMSNIFDVALQMARVLVSPSETSYAMEEDALEELALKPLNSPGFLSRSINPFSYREAVVMHENAVELVGLLWDSLTSDEKRVTAFINSPDPNPITQAAKHGNFHFLSILLSTYPDLLFTCDHNKHTIIHHAILNRHVDIFKFIHIGSAKTLVTTYRDPEGNNMLHLAAKLAPPNRLNIVPGAALQLQRELLWFEEVKKVMDPHEVDRKKLHSSDFPLDLMFLWVEDMKAVVNGVEYNEGLFKKLKKVFKQQGSKLKENHPSCYQGQGQPDMKSSMNQGDVVLLFKKLKKVMDGYNEVRNAKQFLALLRYHEDIARFEINQESDTKILLEKLKCLTENYKQLQERVPNMFRRLEIRLLFEEIDGLIRQHEFRREDGEHIIKSVKRNIQMKMLPAETQYWRLKNLFEEMEKIMEQHIDTIMAAEYTPHDVFVIEHKNLMEKGEKWMRDTANSCMIVAVLITTIAFAAAITVPGGNSDNGYPNFSSEILFKAFAIADSVSMISSAVSLLNFLSILTARYTMDDFRWSLPNKLFVGLLTIFISIVATMAAFVLSIFIIFKSGSPLFSILIAMASSAPIALFLWQHSGLFVDIFRSTYASYFLFKPRNDPSSVFKQTSSFSVEVKKNV